MYPVKQNVIFEDRIRNQARSGVKIVREDDLIVKIIQNFKGIFRNYEQENRICEMDTRSWNLNNIL